MVGLTLNGKTINEAEVKVLAVLDYMFHGSCRKVSKVLSLALKLIRKSAVHYLAKKVSEIRVAEEPSYRRCIAVDETIHMVCRRCGFKGITGSGGVLWEEQPKRPIIP